jgi:hypothetical protein
MSKPNTAQLTPEERQAQQRALNFYRYSGKSEKECEQLVWRDLQAAFPRLLHFDGFASDPAHD